MSVTLRELMDGIGAVRVDDGRASLDVVIARATIDSRRAGPGVVFVACRGATPTSRDGHEFISAARAAGASALIVEDRARVPALDASPTAGGALGESCALFEVKDARRAAAVLAERVCGNPTSSLALIGVTGTNGKTTTTWLVAAILDSVGREAAVVGTLGIGRVPHPKSTGFTTPEAEVISERLRALVDDGVKAVAMETSSHALATARVDGLRFAVGAYTNLTRDHLDFHGTMEAYFAAKARLFADLLPKSAPAVIPGDDDDGGGWAAKLRALRPDALTWGTGRSSRLRAVDIVHDARGMRGALVFDGARAPFESPLLGRFNLENLLVASGCVLALGVPLADVARALATARPPPGRMQRVVPPAGSHAPSVVVDYAHTPDALERSLHALRGLGGGKLYVVFGCGGDRDPGKRSIMGAIAADVADAVVVTDDNPRSEDGDLIADAIEAGISARRSSPKRRVSARDLAPGTFTRVRARRFAIRSAIAAAHEDDVVLVAGKGHEGTQTIGARVLPFDDAREVSRALADEPAPAFLDDAFVLSALAGHSVEVTDGRATAAPVFAGVSTDSRRIEPDSLFVALVGDTFDGHTFVERALAGGARAAVVQRGRPHGSTAGVLYVVDDTLRALQDLARAHLARVPAKRVAITGSNGKTTSKQLVQAALAEAYGAASVVATVGNLNNHIGLPLTALTVEPEHAAAILEMGMNHLGEIDALAEIARPHVGLITNMGTAHAGLVGGVEGVAKAKAELWDRMSGTGGVAVVNADDPRCVREAQARASSLRSVSFGRAPWADVRLVSVRDVEGGGQALEIVVSAASVTCHAGAGVGADAVTLETTIPLEGRHNAMNACGAIAVGLALGLDPAVCARGVSRVHVPHGRLERRRGTTGALVLDDTYNANPDSMEAAFAALDDLAGARRRIVALGEMKELGDFAEQSHRHIGAAAAQHGAAVLFACGDMGRLYGEGAALHGLTSERFVWAADSIALAPMVAAKVEAGDVVLVKGSRGARMEHVVDALVTVKGERH